MANISLDTPGRELERFDLDFEQLKDWRNEENDGLPICSFLSFYKAAGIMSYIEEYCREGKQIAALDNLACNFYTLQRIKNFIKETWETYSLDIDGDNNVFWDETSLWGKNEKHYKKTLHAKISKSLLTDFANYCPGLDDNLPDNIIVFKELEPEVDKN